MGTLPTGAQPSDRAITLEPAQPPGDGSIEGHGQTKGVTYEAASANGTTGTVVSITAAASYAPEPELIDAVDLARAAALDEAGAELVGDHIGALMESERVATHLFTCLSPGYRGWNWAVTVARVPGEAPTVNDVVLLPGDDALTAPAWVPWSERVQAGDLGVGDLLLTSADDPRLIAGLTGEDELEGVASLTPLGFGSWEIGIGRERVLSAIGREDAADRWMESVGPNSPMAKSAPLTCTSCGFLMTIGGPLGQLFGVCANVMSPADGHVVAMTYGCGTHSEVTVEASVGPLGEVITVDDDEVLLVDLDAIADVVVEPMSVDEEVFVDEAEIVDVDADVDTDVDEPAAIEEPSEPMHEHLDLELQAVEDLGSTDAIADEASAANNQDQDDEVSF